LLGVLGAAKGPEAAANATRHHNEIGIIHCSIS
jgi:hypothetical protein